MKRLILLSLLFALLFSGYIAFADMAAPDSMSIDTIYANRSLLSNNDTLIYGQYNVAYASTPNVTIAEAFVFRLIDTDGTTELGADEVYAYKDNGYGKGVFAFYFPATANLTWNQNYYIRIAGKPSVFSSPPMQDFIMASGAWSKQTTPEGNQDELSANIVTLANTLTTAWGSLYKLLDQADIGMVLSVQGENYFRNAIPGLQAMAPKLFYAQIESPDFTTRNYTTNQSAYYEGRWTGTWVQTSLDALQTMFHTDWNMTASIIIVLGCVFCLVASAMGRGDAYGGMVGSLVLILMGAVLGWVPMAMMATGALLCILYIGYWWFFSKA